MAFKAVELDKISKRLNKKTLRGVKIRRASKGGAVGAARQLGQTPGGCEVPPNS